MEKHFTATALIVHEKKILLLFHKKLQSWLPPGGHMEANELPHECAIREAKEETGIDIEIVSTPCRVFDNFAWELPRPFCMLEEVIPLYKETPEHRHIDHVFLASVKNTKTNSDEELKWFSLEEIKNLSAEKILENARQLCIQVLSNEGDLKLVHHA